MKNRPKRADGPRVSIADRIAENPQLLLSRDEVDEVFGLSKRFLELAAWKGDGPRMVKISRRMVRYRAADVCGLTSVAVGDCGITCGKHTRGVYDER